MDIFDIVNEDHYEDITESFQAALDKLPQGTLVHSSMFQLKDAISAIEIMDPRMDFGMKSNSDGLMQQLVNVKDSYKYHIPGHFRCLYIIDRIINDYLLVLRGFSIHDTILKCGFYYNFEELECNNNLNSKFSFRETLDSVCITDPSIFELFKDSDYKHFNDIESSGFHINPILEGCLDSILYFLKFSSTLEFSFIDKESNNGMFSNFNNQNIITPGHKEEDFIYEKPINLPSSISSTQFYAFVDNLISIHDTCRYVLLTSIILYSLSNEKENIEINCNYFEKKDNIDNLNEVYNNFKLNEAKLKIPYPILLPFLLFSRIDLLLKTFILLDYISKAKVNKNNYIFSSIKSITSLPTIKNRKIEFNKNDLNEDLLKLYDYCTEENALNFKSLTLFNTNRDIYIPVIDKKLIDLLKNNNGCNRDCNIMEDCNLKFNLLLNQIVNEDIILDSLDIELNFYMKLICKSWINNVPNAIIDIKKDDYNEYSDIDYCFNSSYIKSYNNNLSRKINYTDFNHFFNKFLFIWDGLVDFEINLKSKIILDEIEDNDYENKMKLYEDNSLFVDTEFDEITFLDESNLRKSFNELTTQNYSSLYSNENNECNNDTNILFNGYNVFSIDTITEIDYNFIEFKELTLFNLMDMIQKIYKRNIFQRNIPGFIRNIYISYLTGFNMIGLNNSSCFYFNNRILSYNFIAYSIFKYLCMDIYNINENQENIEIKLNNVKSLYKNWFILNNGIRSNILEYENDINKIILYHNRNSCQTHRKLKDITNDLLFDLRNIFLKNILNIEGYKRIKEMVIKLNVNDKWKNQLYDNLREIENGFREIHENRNRIHKKIDCGEILISLFNIMMILITILKTQQIEDNNYNIHHEIIITLNEILNLFNDGSIIFYGWIYELINKTFRYKIDVGEYIDLYQDWEMNIIRLKEMNLIFRRIQIMSRIKILFLYIKPLINHIIEILNKNNQQKELIERYKELFEDKEYLTQIEALIEMFDIENITEINHQTRMDLLTSYQEVVFNQGDQEQFYDLLKSTVYEMVYNHNIGYNTKFELKTEHSLKIELKNCKVYSSGSNECILSIKNNEYRGNMELLFTKHVFHYKDSFKKIIRKCLQQQRISHTNINYDQAINNKVLNMFDEMVDRQIYFHTNANIYL